MVKKETAEKIVYDALSISSKKTKEEPLTVLEKALQKRWTYCRGQIKKSGWFKLSGPY